MSKLYVVGIGPGGYEQMTVKAVKVLEECDIIVGYTVYVDLVAEHFAGKEMLTTPMRQEEKRCRMAFDEVMKGRNTAMICSGDAGVYGMSGLIYEISRDYPGIEIEIVSGVMTPWTLIEKRLAAAASADMAICLYNPSSKKRRDYLNKACRIVMQSALPETVCGIVKQIGREGESCQVMTLQELSNYEADMFTTVFIGNSTTKVINGKMVTPRGYKLSE